MDRRTLAVIVLLCVPVAARAGSPAAPAKAGASALAVRQAAFAKQAKRFGATVVGAVRGAERLFESLPASQGVSSSRRNDDGAVGEERWERNGWAGSQGSTRLVLRATAGSSARSLEAEGPALQAAKGVRIRQHVMILSPKEAYITEERTRRYGAEGKEISRHTRTTVVRRVAPGIHLEHEQTEHQIHGPNYYDRWPDIDKKALRIGPLKITINNPLADL